MQEGSAIGPTWTLHGRCGTRCIRVTEKGQFQTEKCQFRTEKCQFTHLRAAAPVDAQQAAFDGAAAERDLFGARRDPARPVRYAVGARCVCVQGGVAVHAVLAVEQCSYREEWPYGLSVTYLAPVVAGLECRCPRHVNKGIYHA